MDHSARIRVSNTDESSAEQSPIKEQLWPMSLKQNEGMESEPYPERLGEQDCAYYMRTGLCSYGMSCRFNHPPKRKLVIAAERLKGDYPERIGEPECQYFLKTGVCKFGATCKFHHPKEKAGISGRAVLNMLGYPLRLDEKECAYYMRTGQCKFGSACKFHHPQPSSLVVPLNGSSVYSPATPGQQSYPGGIPWSRTSFVSSPRWQGPSNYTQMLLPGMLPVTGWNTYTVQSPSDAPEQAPANGHLYSASQETEAMSIGIPGSFSSCLPIPSSLGFYAVQKENIFPERPGQPDCQFYMKTGDCKFGSVCRFHHPKERLIPVPNSLLSPLGLPLRPGEQLCAFYCRYGLCKFGPSCKFDHPIRTYPYNASLSSRAPVNRSEPNLQRR